MRRRADESDSPGWRENEALTWGRTWERVRGKEGRGMGSLTLAGGGSTLRSGGLASRSWASSTVRREASLL